MPEPDFKEKRAFLRFPICLPVTCYDYTRQIKAEFQTHDIGANGFGLITDKPFEPDTTLDISLDKTDDAEYFYAKGKVVWQRAEEANKYRVGVELDEPKLKPIPLILKVIQSRIQR